MEYFVTMLTPFGEQQAIQRVKPKGVVEIDGKEYQESVVIHDKGFLANKVIKRHERVTASGLYERREDGSESLLVPRPLETGQTWTNQNEVRKFEGIENFETFNSPIPTCARITVITRELDSEGRSKSSRHTQYYERGKGMIYKGSDGGTIGYTKVLRAYAAGSESR